MHDSPRSTSPAPLPSATGRWQLADVIDFEFLLEQDQHRPLAELEQRDQAIATETALGGQPLARDRRRLFRAWLEARRAATGTAALPGQLAVAGWRMLLKIVTVIALLLGAGAASNLLRYDGAQPINVATYLGWLVLVQIVLVVVALALLLLRRAGWLSTEASLLHGFVRWAWSGLALRLNRHLGDRVPAAHRQALASFLGRSSVFKQLYGRVAWWPVVGALQWFGVCFNIGAIITTLALVVFSDRAFGWQSAVNFSPEQIHQLTQTLASPWSALLPSAAAPTLDQITGSKIVLKDGIRQLATEDLVAWWPFLVAAVTVYGFLTRFTLWLATLWLGRQALNQLEFHHVVCDRLYERLAARSMQTQAPGSEAPRTDLPIGSPALSSAAVDNHKNDNRNNQAVLLISPELEEQVEMEKLTTELERRFQLRMVKTLAWSDAAATRAAALRELEHTAQTTTGLRIVLLEEAWQPPIAEKLAGLRALREATGADVRLVVTLVGRPSAGELLTPVKPSDLRVWQERLQALADPQLRVEALTD